MNFKKQLVAACCALLSVFLVACNVPPSAPGGADRVPTGSETVGGEIADDNRVEVLTPETKEHDFRQVSQSNGTFRFQCADCGEEETVTVTYISGTENAYTVTGNVITFQNITEKSAYGISGKFHGNLVIDVTEDYKFELELNGLELYSDAACPITVLSGDKFTLSAKKSTENYIYDVRKAVDKTDENAISASVYALCDLDLQGKGSLNVKSINNNGIHTKDDLNVKNLDLQVDCTDNALKGNDSVTVESGELILIARQGDGIKTSNSSVSSKGKQKGTVSVTGGNILIYAACDGIDAAYDVKIDESSATVNLQIFTNQYSKYSEAAQTNAQLLDEVTNGTRYARGGFGGPGGGPGGGFGGPNDGNSDKSDVSSKGIKAANEITVSGGTLTVSAYDDAVHANADGDLENGATPLGNVTVTGGNVTLKSNDDGIHADGKVSVQGGSVSVVSSYEGIEGSRVEITGGSVTVVASDDGINGTATSGTTITISGGNLYVTAGGDGLDSNSTTAYEGILFAGGTSVVISTGNSDSSIDTERGYQYAGGYVIGIGRSGGMGTEATKCSNFSAVGTGKTLTLQKDAYLVVEGIATVKMPASFGALVVVLGKPNATVASANSTSYSLDANGVYWH